MMNSVGGGEPAVVVEHLRVIRGKRTVLPDLSCVIPKGKVVGLLGPSGGGKTTLMRCVMGVQVVASGSVTVLGRPAGHPRLRDRIGYRTQAPSVYEDLSVEENLRYFAAVLGARRVDVDRAIDDVSLGSHRKQTVGRLSGGQQARVSLAVALLGTPELLVLDEPTVGLDPLLRDELWGLFGELAGRGITLLVSSHVMDEASRCERLLLLREGRLLADGSPARLRAETGAADLEHAFLSRIEQDRAVPA